MTTDVTFEKSSKYRSRVTCFEAAVAGSNTATHYSGNMKNIFAKMRKRSGSGGSQKMDTISLRNLLQYAFTVGFGYYL